MFPFSNHTLRWVEPHTAGNLSHQGKDEVLS
ncbi:hypothetical protein F887_01812 [Acinetobacter sp. NIPH 2100]|nr:hypothetical protein F887_01812 [Acinetobacter sp. NIPH 2100]